MPRTATPQSCGCGGLGRDLAADDQSCVPPASAGAAVDFVVIAGAPCASPRVDEHATVVACVVDRLTSGRRIEPTKQILVPPSGRPFRFHMGSDWSPYPDDHEGPVRRVLVQPFLLDETEVSNEQFAEFVRATSHVTDSEKYGWSYVFEQFVVDTHQRDANMGPTHAPWWVQTFGASWAAPDGPGSEATNLADHPVTHVSWNDAAAYCAWLGRRLPTEAEWEGAARGGVHQAMLPWGQHLTPDGVHRANLWQGDFPAANSADDGFRSTAPVRSFEPQNAWGLYNMIGNVWEWVDGDWGVEPVAADKVEKGGSLMCHISYCFRYRNSARTHAAADSGSGNVGFRCAAAPS